MNAKAKGTRNEHRSIVLLESAGYACCRSAASLGAWDIIGVGPVDIVLVQVKSNRAPSPAERETMQLFPAPTNARKLIHIWHDRHRMPEVRSL